MATSGSQDPGWRPNFKQLFLHHLTPWSVLPKYRAEVHPLTTLRTLFLSLLLAGPLLLNLLTFIAPFGDPSAGLAAGLAAVGLACLAGARWAWNRDLRIESREEIRSSFQSIFLLAFALSEAPLLVTFAVSVSIEAWWPLLIGLAAFFLGMASIAPTRGRLEAKDTELRARGSRWLLTEVLSTPPEAGPAAK